LTDRDKETLQEQDGGPESSHRGPSEVSALVVAWARDEPWRLGQVLTVQPTDFSRPLVFGRGPADQPSKILLKEQRPGGSRDAPPLESATVSRVQLEFRPAGRHRIFVRNVGKCALFRNERQVAEAEYEVGETLQIGNQIMFLVVRRPSVLWGEDPAYPAFSFGDTDPFGIVGESAAAWRLRGEIALAARRPGHVLVAGPSGTGKELAARAIHALSRRNGQRLVARNAATLPESLIDAELFGNAKNYPNPGMAERSGLVGQADGSTLFLDEIAELPTSSQAHLLRVLDDGEYHRLGDGLARRSDFRLVAATNRDVAALKRDLFARFALRVDIPPLDARREDIPLLVRHIVRRAARSGDEIARRLLPGGDPSAEPMIKLRVMRSLLLAPNDLNVRQLESTLWESLAEPVRGSIAAKCPEPTIGTDQDLPRPTGGKSPSDVAAADRREEEPPTGDDWPPERIQHCLDEHNGVLELAWRALGMKNRFALLRAIKKHDLVVRKRPGHGPLRRS
jgi:two-component system nitrogen regulation response regulator GlnG/two-component system response regulator HydG